jgi:uncharacterized membrane protein HdeD (DUF308 family)
VKGSKFEAEFCYTEGENLHKRGKTVAKLATAVGVLLIALGVVFFGLTQQKTALIPSGIGLFILVFGLIARDPARRKHAMHGAVFFGLLGFLGSLMGAKNWPALLSGQAHTLARPLAALEQLIMAVICLFFVIACVKSFIDARRAA